jgi:hypothetical protein
MTIKKIGIGVLLFLVIVVSISHAAILSSYISITGQVTIIAPEPPGPNVPETIFQCMSEGWQEYTRLDGTPFQNQGLCVSYVATNMCSQDGWRILTREDGSSFKNKGQCVAYFVSQGAIQLSKQSNPELFIMEANEIQEIEEENIIEEIMPEEIVKELIIEHLNSSEARILYAHKGLLSFNFSCENEFEADTFDWYFGDAIIISNSTQEISHTFSDSNKMHVTCYALNSTTFKSGHATIKMSFE